MSQEQIVNCTAKIAQFNKPIISVTGSCGKTTTCKMIQDLLANNYTTNKTLENCNNFQGIPWSVNNFFTPTADIWVIELGIDRVNQMDKLVAMVKPTVRIITNIYNAHLNNFNSLKDYQNEKLKLFDSCQPNNIVIVNNDIPVLANYMKTHPFPPSVKIIYCGSKDTDDVQFINYKLNPDNISSTISIRLNKMQSSLLTFNLDGINKHNAFNCCLAVACALHFNIPINTIRNVLNNFKLYKNRGLITTMPKYILYDYTYNGTIYAFMKNLENFKTIPGKHKLIILGISTHNSHTKSINECIMPINYALGITNNVFVYTAQKDLFNKNKFKNAVIVNSFDVLLREISLLFSLEKTHIFIQGANELKLFDFVDKLINI